MLLDLMSALLFSIQELDVD